MQIKVETAEKDLANVDVTSHLVDLRTPVDQAQQSAPIEIKKEPSVDETPAMSDLPMITSKPLSAMPAIPQALAATGRSIAFRLP